MNVNKYLLPLLTLLALFGSYAVARLTNTWSVSGKQTISVDQMTSGADVRGWMTLEQISTGFDIPLDELYTLIGVPPEIPPHSALKDMESLVPGFEVSLVREQIDSWILGSPRLVTKTQAPLPTEVPESKRATETGPAMLATPDHQSQGDGTGIGPTPLPPGTRLPASEIKGRHSLQEIADQCQVPLLDLMKILALPENTNPTLTAKDLVSTGKIAEIQILRDAVASLQQ